MKSKRTDTAITGLVIGIIIGIIAGLGGMNMIKKSQRSSTMMYIVVGLSMVVFGSTGYSIGNNLGKDLEMEAALGHDKLDERIVQNGRGWLAITVWTNRDGTEYKLLTGQADDKTLISQLNGITVINHEIKSGSQVNVTKFHQSARNQIFAFQKMEYKS